MLPTKYLDSHYLETLGIEPYIRSMCSHLDRDEYSERKNVTYRNLTLEFLNLTEAPSYSDDLGMSIPIIIGSLQNC